jgi:pre-mRNA-processing factor 17
MPSLLAGYESSDDGEVEHAGPQLQQEEEEDDAQIAAQIQQDAFGLSASGPSRQRASRSEAGSHILSAPDVLKEVSDLMVEISQAHQRQDPNGAGMAIIARPTDKVINVNIKYDDMNRPVAGPIDPFDHRKNKGMNSLSGGYGSIRCPPPC